VIRIIALTSVKSDDLYKLVLIECPRCHKREKLKIPKQIIGQNKKLTTVSIPSDFLCEHSFQVFIDNNFSVRGYQKVDFEISKMEYYENYSETKQDGKNFQVDSSPDNLLPYLQEIVSLIRDCLTVDVILGCAIFTIEGRILYSSLTADTLYNIIREFEVRNEKNLIMVRKLFHVLENNHKICSEFVKIHTEKLIVVLSFSQKVKLGMANWYLSDLIKKINKIEQKVGD